jgi:hypothetical protein
VEDFGVIYLGSASFKIARLLFVAMFSVHIFACIFFRVKIVSATSPEDVSTFYTSRNVAEDVRYIFNVLQFFVLRKKSGLICSEFGGAGPRTAICEILLLILCPRQRPFNQICLNL